MLLILRSPLLSLRKMLGKGNRGVLATCHPVTSLPASSAAFCRGRISPWSYSRGRVCLRGRREETELCSGCECTSVVLQWSPGGLHCYK